MDGFRIERVAYEDEYGSGEDLAAMLLAEALADSGAGMGEGGASSATVGGSAPTPDRCDASATSATPRRREGDEAALPAPLPLAEDRRCGEAAAIGGALSAAGPARSPQRFGPEPLLTRPLQALFGEHLARHGNVRLACRAARVSAQTAYRMRRASASFRALWDAALVIARDQVEDVLADRAVHGWEEAVFYHGEEVARRRRYDSRLLLAHLARLDKLAERAAGGVVERFDEVIDTLSADEDFETAERVPAEAGTSGGVALDGGRPLPAQGLSDDGEDGEDGTPLLEAQLQWLEEQYGTLTDEEEVFHLLHTVPGVPGSEFRRFGWRGGNGDLARDQEEADQKGADQPCSSSMLTGAEPVLTMPICSAAACDRSSTRPRA